VFCSNSAFAIDEKDEESTEVTLLWSALLAGKLSSETSKVKSEKIIS